MPTKIIIVLVIALTLLGGGYYLYTLSTANPQTQTEAPRQTGNNSSGKNFVGSLIDLLTLGQNTTCTFATTDDSGSQTSGLVFASAGGNKLSGEFELTDPEGSVTTSHVISDGEYSYFWSSELEEGIKVKLDPEDTSLFGKTSGESRTSFGIDEKEPVDFNCQPWVVDNSKFVPPSHIEFKEFEAPKLETLPNAMEDKPDCSVCDQLPAGSARDQCLSALGC